MSTPSFRTVRVDMALRDFEAFAERLHYLWLAPEDFAIRLEVEGVEIGRVIRRNPDRPVYRSNVRELQQHGDIATCTEQADIVLTRNLKPFAVLISAAEYERLTGVHIASAVEGIK